MKKILVAVFALYFLFSGFVQAAAVDKVNDRARFLIARMKKAPQQTPSAETPLLNITSSPSEPK